MVSEVYLEEPKEPPKQSRVIMQEQVFEKGEASTRGFKNFETSNQEQKEEIDKRLRSHIQFDFCHKIE